MRVVFADALYWIAMANPADPWRAAALEATHALGAARLVTTEEVLGEFLAALRRGPHLRQQAALRVRQLHAQPNVEVVPQTPESFEAGLTLYEARPDKEYSLVDCISMTTMRARVI